MKCSTKRALVAEGHIELRAREEDRANYHGSTRSRSLREEDSGKAHFLARSCRRACRLGSCWHSRSLRDQMVKKFARANFWCQHRFITKSGIPDFWIQDSRNPEFFEFVFSRFLRSRILRIRDYSISSNSCFWKSRILRIPEIRNLRFLISRFFESRAILWIGKQEKEKISISKIKSLYGTIVEAKRSSRA